MLQLQEALVQLIVEKLLVLRLSLLCLLILAPLLLVLVLQLLELVLLLELLKQRMLLQQKMRLLLGRTMLLLLLLLVRLRKSQRCHRGRDGLLLLRLCMGGTRGDVVPLFAPLGAGGLKRGSGRGQRQCGVHRRR